MNTSDFKSLAEAKFKHAQFRKNLRERIEAQLTVAHNGGLFKATKELISFVSLWPAEKELYLEDEYNNPVKCDKEGLKEQLIEAYQFAMNAWHIDFEKSRKIRNASHV